MVWSGSRPACLPLPFICLPVLFICLPVLFICLPGWVLVVGFPAGLSPTSFHLSPTSFHLSPSSFHLSPRLGACGRVPGWLVSHFLSFVSQFFSFVSQATSILLFTCLPVLFPGWVLVVGFRPACLPLAFICLPLLFICLPLLFNCLPVLHLSLRLGWRLACLPLPFMSPRLGACGRVPGRLVSQAGCLWSGSGWLVSPFHLSPKLGACGRVPGRLVSHLLRVPGRLVSHFLSFVSHFFSACGRVPGRLVSHFLSFVSHFFSFVSQAGCLWSGSRPACLPLAFICLPVLFICLPGFSAGHVAFLFICLPCDFFLFVFQVWCLHCCFLPCPLEQVRL